ncbi:MAG: efflux RND transporter permease subunit [Dehalococcoidia bacterium]
MRLARAENTRSVTAVVLSASLEVRSAIVYATLISVLTLMPVFFLQGLSGSFFRPLALSYALAMLASMVVAMTVTPALSYILLRNAASRPRTPRSSRRSSGCTGAPSSRSSGTRHRVCHRCARGARRRPRGADARPGCSPRSRSATS